jgi:hypothetical protein
MYLNTLCFSPVGCRSWQSDIVDFLAGNILLLLLSGGARLGVLHSKKRHIRIRQVVKPAERHLLSKGRGSVFRQPDSYARTRNLASAAIILAGLL